MEILKLMNKSLLFVWVTNTWEYNSIKKWVLKYVLEKLSRSFRNNAVLSISLGKPWTHLTYLLTSGRMCPQLSNMTYFLHGLGRNTMLQQILVVQKKLVRIAFRLPYRSSCPDQLHSLFGLPSPCCGDLLGQRWGGPLQDEGHSGSHPHSFPGLY